MLKTDYKNDKFEGKRRYQMTENADGTISFDDGTVYKEIGDIFNADDVNQINDTVNVNTETISGIKALRYVTLETSKWSSSAPYTQLVSVAGVKDTDSPVISLNIPEGVSGTTKKNIKKSWDCVDRIVVGNGVITAYCNDIKPVSTFQIMIKGE